MKYKRIILAGIVCSMHSCTSIPEKYKDDCVDGACTHIVNRCKQIKATGNGRLHSQYGVSPIKNYNGPAVVDGLWTVRCKNGKIIEIMDSEFKTISSYELISDHSVHSL